MLLIIATTHSANYFSFAVIEIEADLADLGRSLLQLRTLGFVTSVTRWLDCLFNIWPFSTLIICPILFRICQIELKILPNTKSTHSKWSKFFNVGPEWLKFRKIWSHWSWVCSKNFLEVKDRLAAAACQRSLLGAWHHLIQEVSGRSRKTKNASIQFHDHKNWLRKNWINNFAHDALGSFNGSNPVR